MTKYFLQTITGKLCIYFTTEERIKIDSARFFTEKVDHCYEVLRLSLSPEEDVRILGYKGKHSKVADSLEEFLGTGDSLKREGNKYLFLKRPIDQLSFDKSAITTLVALIPELYGDFNDPSIETPIDEIVTQFLKVDCTGEEPVEVCP